MNNSISLKKDNGVYKVITTILAVAAAVILPQIFHAIGTLSGTGTSVGVAFLPMHIPVLLAGFLGGPVVGIIAGILSPIVSFGISGMPTAMMLPWMVIELAGYGVIAGLLSKVQMNTFLKLIIAQVGGRVIRGLAVVIAIYVFGNTQLTIESIGALFTSGLFGIILQMAFIPLLVDRLESKSKL